jgi:hypothetical protein
MQSENATPLSKTFSGQCWAAKLIKQVVYYSLNAWQIRNNHLLHKEKEQAEYYKEREQLKQQVTEWYAIQNDEIFQPNDAQYFNTPQLERRNDTHERKKKWCTAIQAIYDFNKYQKQRTHGKDIGEFYTKVPKNN